MHSSQEAASLTGISTAALRYYENEGVLPPIARNSSGYRQYTDEDIEWIQMIQCMRRADISIHEIKEYVSLLAQGGKTLVRRLAMVKRHAQDIERRMSQLQSALALTRRKAAFYESLLADGSHENISYRDEWKRFKHGSV